MHTQDKRLNYWRSIKIPPMKVLIPIIYYFLQQQSCRMKKCYTSSQDILHSNFAALLSVQTMFIQRQGNYQDL